jgi:hypothetical protein
MSLRSPVRVFVVKGFDIHFTHLSLVRLPLIFESLALGRVSHLPIRLEVVQLLHFVNVEQSLATMDD